MTEKEKNPAAVSLGRLGGLARAAKMSGEDRSMIARKAALARWDKVKKDSEDDTASPDVDDDSAPL